MKSKLVPVRAAVAVALIAAFAAVFGPAGPALALNNPPGVDSVSPAAGPTAGGTTVTITGHDFLNTHSATIVDFGSTQAAPTLITDTEILVPSPPHPAGTVDITVTNFAGISVNSAADHFTYFPPPPQVTSVSPTSGPSAGGTAVTVTGSGFTGAKEVDFGPSNKGSGMVVNNDTQIVVTSPPTAAGTVDVTVITDGGTSVTSNSDKFAFVDQPTVSGVSPNGGSTAGGTAVTITGTNFVGVSAVDFNTTPASSFTVNSPTQISATSPAANSAGTVTVIVSATGGTSDANANANNTFAYVNGPVVSSLQPTGGSAGGGTQVVITGSGFSGTANGTPYTTSAVHFGPNAATTFHVDSPTQITATAPAGSGTVQVHVTTPFGTNGDTGANHDNYSYVGVAPQVNGVSPGGGKSAGGDTVTISGVGFTGATCPGAVSFGTGNLASTCNVVSDTQMTAVSPSSLTPSSPTTVDITVTVGGHTSTTNSNDQFVYMPPPTVTSLSVSNGLVGITVTITGTNFGSPNPGTPIVTFGPNQATVTSFTSTSVTATSPDGRDTVDVRVATRYGGQSATSVADEFTYWPTVTGVSPTQGPEAGGTSVTIFGTGFMVPSATVRFGANSGTGISITNDSQMTATSPPGTGIVDVRVTTCSGCTSPASSGDKFDYRPQPMVTSVSPTFGSTQGGDTVVIGGSGFTGAGFVEFGPGNNAQSFNVDSDTQITAVSPSGNPGFVDVEVTSAGGTSTVNSGDQYQYVAVPTVTSVSPPSGPTSGGTSVTVTGSGFSASVPTVKFGSTAATGVIVADDSHLTATSPAEAAGTVDVTVTTIGGTSPTSPADHFTYFPRPAVTGVNPTFGPSSGGTAVTITGTGFTGATAVNFGANPAQTFTVNNNTKITATSPAGAVGFVDVQVTSPGGTSTTNSGDRYQYVTVPTVTSVSPSSGPRTGGTSVSVTGTGFSQSAPTVKFGATPATGVSVLDDSHLTAISPAGSVGTVHVTVTTLGGTSATSSADQFTYAALGVAASGAFPPGIIGGYGPEQVTVFGSGFQPDTTVTINNPGVSVVVKSISPTQIVTTMNTSSASASAASVGPSDLTVHNPDGGTAVVHGFFVLAAGYYTTTQSGTVSNFGSVPFAGDLTGVPLNKPIVGMASTPDGNGYWLVASDGGIFAFGDAGFYGSEGGAPLNKPIVGMAATPTGHGYWLVASDGGIFTHGDAGFFGSEGGAPLNKPVVGMSPTRSGQGYWLVATDGGIFTHGDAGFFGSEGGAPLNKPVVGMAPTPSGQGYWLVASDGGVFTHGDAPFRGSTGSLHLNSPVVGMAPGLTGDGYYLLGGDGGIFTFNVPFFGSSPSGGSPAVSMTDVARVR